MEKHGGSTVAFYTNGSAIDPVEAHAALGEILSLPGYKEKGESRPIKVSTTGRWEAKVHLRELVDRSMDGLDFGEEGLDIKVGGEVSLDFASLSVARLVIRRMGAELLGLEPAGALMVRSFSKPGKDTSAYVISIQANIWRQAAKSLLSEISAMELRLSGYCLRLGRAMGLSIPAPHTLIGGGKADLRFEIAGGFAMSDGDWRMARADRIFHSLSSRERQVLEMVAGGLGNEEISKRLGIMASTVKQHIKNIYKRTGIRSRLELILRAG
ncbi:MAG: helix-turn-helix transcriptional regulator [Nitrospinae bacterium]|nr:helix-turn-helix transcriptional regulator [Nitrospinota bacterium]MBF0634422.1 helix-turn-helix transcriptional regulator [Nitrospinota bacterium]